MACDLAVHPEHTFVCKAHVELDFDGRLHGHFCFLHAGVGANRGGRWSADHGRPRVVARGWLPIGEIRRLNSCAPIGPATVDDDPDGAETVTQNESASNDQLIVAIVIASSSKTN